MKKKSTYQHLFAFILSLFFLFITHNAESQIAPNQNVVNTQLITGSISNSGNGSLRTDSVCGVHVIVQTVDVLCHGGASGIAAAVAKGGDGTYTFAWSSGQNTQIITNVTAGTYTVTATDALGCADTVAVVISEPSPVVINIPISSTPASCSNICNGTATVSASGGTGSIHYQWSSNNQKGATATGLCAGMHYVTATDDNGCKAVDSVLVGINSTLALNVTDDDVLCFGGNDGKITANGKGGNPPYSYAWSANTGPQSGNMATGLFSGSYGVTVTDNVGCSVQQTQIIIDQPSDLVVSISSNNVNCFGASNGSATANASGGTPPYSYNWSTGATTASINSLSAGTYSVTVTDDNDCEAIESVTITENPSLGISIVGTDATCNGLADASIEVTIAGGVAPYMVDVSGMVNISGGPFPGPVVNIINMGIKAGTYTVTVTDVNGCADSAQVTIGQPTPVDASLSAIHVSCAGANDGEVTLTVTGGSGSGYRFRYSYNNGPKSPVFNYNGPTTGSNLAPGTYSVTVADGNYTLGKQGCFDIVSIVVTEPAPLVGNISGNRVSCAGAMDGSASYAVSGGIPPYNYNWSNGATSSSISGLGGGTYSVTVTDDNACTVSGSYIVEESSELTINIIAKNISCFGANDGLLSVSATGGDAPYTYAWNTGATTPSIPNPQAGSYSVTVTDAQGCFKTGSVTITEPPPFNVAAKPTDATCSNLCDGSAVATASGGSLPYTYTWSNGFNGPNPTGLCAGPYTVTITDASGCSDTAMIVISEPAKIKIGLATQNVTCADDCDGSISIIAGGGTGNISYMWSTGATTSSISGLCAGKYIVSVTDDNQCSEKLSISILAPPPIVLTVNTKDVTCNGGNDGEASVSISGGKAPYKYIWSNFGSTNNTNTNLTAGNYGIKVIDANGCSDSIGFVITEPTPIVIITTKMDANCFGSCDGSALASPSGGIPPYSFAWSSGSTSPSAAGLCAGTYTVTVTDQSGCTASSSVIIGEPMMLVLTTAKVNVTCNGASDGAASVTASDGTPAYSYNWSNGGSSSQITGLAPGNYSVTVTDMNGCTAVASVNIIEPAPLLLNSSSTLVSCNDGSDGTATVSATGGNGGYTYLWSDGQTTPIAIGLAAGTYMVTVTDKGAPDATGNTTFCTAIDTVEVIEPTAVQVSLSMTPVSCNGGNDGTATASAFGGTPPYTYLWSTSSSSASVNSLTAGTYSVTVSDANNCTASGSITVTEPTLLVLSLSSTPVSCNGGNDGTATVSATGGTPAYSFKWSDNQTTPTATGLTAGSYSVTVTDINQCQKVGNVIVSQPTPLVLTTTSQNVSCNGGNDGSATVNASGGTTPYSYLWSNGQSTSTATGLMAGTYTVTVIDDNGCDETISVMISEPLLLTAILNKTDVSCFGGSDGSASANASGGTPPYSYMWSNGASSAIISGLSSGYYVVTVTDNKSCTHVDSIEVLQPTQLMVNITVNQNVSCNGGSDGSATAVASGGTSPYSYNWSNGGTSATQTALAAGSYTVTVTDDNNCTQTGTVTITEPDALVLGSSKTDVSCNGGNDGTATVIPSGGTTPYTYLWSTGATSPMISGLKEGSYTVTVTDSKGCVESIKVTINEPTPLMCTLKGNDPSCFGFTDGSISVVATGGTPFAPPTSPYSYIWQDGTIGQVITGVGAGTYMVTVTDANGCFKVDTFTLGQPDALKLSVSSNDESCPGENDGNASVTPSGGTPPYTYMWTTGATTSSISGLAPATYSVTVTDKNGCVESINVIINPKPKVIYTLDVTNISCATTGSTGSAGISGLGNKGPYSFLWSTGSTSQTVSNLSVGQYTVTITDGNGCKADTSFAITAPDAITLAISGTAVSCNGAADGTATVNALGGSAPYSYSWSVNSGSQTTATATGLSGGTYSVTVMDGQGCSAVESITIFEPTPIAVIVNPASLSCFGDCDGSLTANVSGGNAPYSYLWSVNTGSQTSATASGLCASTYSVTVIADTGCTATATSTISQPTVLVAAVTGDTSVSCNDSCDASLTLSASGGTGPYSFDCYRNSSLILSGNFGSSATKNDLCDGSYMIVVTDVNGCMDTVMATISSPDPLVATANNDTVCANVCDGELTATAAGGTPPYSYMWSDQQTTATASGLCDGTYTVTITDANGCTMSAMGTVIENSPIVVSLKKVKKPTCFGDKDGRIIVKANGGTGNYTFQWNDPNNTMSDTLDNIGQEVIFCVVVTDELGCTATLCHTIHDPKELILEFDSTDAGCGMSNGNAVVSVLGNPLGIGLTFQWSNGDTDPFNLGIPSGVYSVTVTDQNGCVAIDSVTVNDNCPKPAATIGYANKTADSEISVKAYPNPFNSISNVVISDDVDNIVDVELYDLDGRLILNVFNGRMENGNTIVQLDGSLLTNGVYLLKATNNEGESTMLKVVLSR